MVNINYFNFCVFVFEWLFSFSMVSADYATDKAQFFKKEAFQAFELMDDRTPDYYISYNPFKHQHDQGSRSSHMQFAKCKDLSKNSRQYFLHIVYMI